MRVALINTGSELLLGDVRDLHLAFIAQQILPLGLRISEQRTVPDGTAIRDALSDLFRHFDLLFVTGGLGPTSDDITREITAELLGLKLLHNDEVMAAITQRLRVRGIKLLDTISRQAMVPDGAEVLPNENGTARGLYLPNGINPLLRSPHLFLLPGPPRELQPMFRQSVLPRLSSIAPASSLVKKLYKLANTGESIVEKAIGQQILAIPGVELGYCARPGEVDVRIVGAVSAVTRADEIIRRELDASIFSAEDETLEQVIVTLLASRKETLALAESCTGGLLANRLTNVPGASDVFIAGYVTYANTAKIDVLQVDPELIEQHGAVSQPVARAMAEGARARAGSTYALATTGIAGPAGGSAEKPAGTVFVALASSQETIARKFFFPNDRETFKQMTAQAAFELLRRKLLVGRRNAGEGAAGLSNSVEPPPDFVSRPAS
ncbi:MAG: nicotinamide-nucleotide amidase [Verrucomicrobiota bacterium]|jgi:nicotinamide-nucleotide amidase